MSVLRAGRGKLLRLIIIFIYLDYKRTIIKISHPKQQRMEADLLGRIFLDLYYDEQVIIPIFWADGDTKTTKPCRKICHTHSIVNHASVIWYPYHCIPLSSTGVITKRDRVVT